MSLPTDEGHATRIAAAERRRRRRDRVLFVATWVILALVVIAALASRLDFTFLGEWGPFILEIGRAHV